MKALTHLALALAAACSWAPARVVMVGPAAEVSALAGEWSGEYRSVEAQRSGTIWFKLEAGRDTAYGDVLMLPRESNVVSEPTAPGFERPASMSRVLTIKFVRVEGAWITGTIDPYPGPDCGCELSTSFRGTLKGDRIEGDFLIAHSGKEKAPQSGTWFATRVKKNTP